tara:strand:- start:371 stop:760 length:390 start_codon:yes stop_codon:yes gene_type:complete
MGKKDTLRPDVANILIAHGSRDPLWRKPFENLLDKSRISSPNKVFYLCYLELCEPNMNDILKELTKNNSNITTINIFPILLSAGVHFNKDIQKKVKDLYSIYPQIKFKLNDVIGDSSIVSDAIVKVITS